MRCSHGGKKNYPCASDASLAKMVKESDLDAFAELLSRYLWLVHEKSRAFVSTCYLERDDLFQEGLWGIYLAAKAFDVHRGTSFKAFAAVCVHNQMLSALRTSGSKKNLPLNEALSLSTEYLDVFHSETPESIVESKEALDVLIKKINTSLSPLERKVLALYLSGYDRSDTVDGIGTKVFDNALHRARMKLKN